MSACLTWICCLTEKRSLFKRDCAAACDQRVSAAGDIARVRGGKAACADTGGRPAGWAVPSSPGAESPKWLR
eukprot:12909946-Heterocapsa_arctica.AAC.1